MQSKIAKAGFTLAELLIALALLGIIAAFTIPKVLQSSTDQETNAKLRETAATLEQAWYNLRATNSVTPNTLYDNLVPSLNTAMQNNTPLSVPLPAPASPLIGVANHPCDDNTSSAGWVMFANGVVVHGLNADPLDLLPYNHASHGFGHNYLLCIDVNGAGGPNRPGQDVFYGNFNQYGGYQTPPTTEQQSLRSFRWGCAGADHASCDVYQFQGDLPFATMNYGNVGDSLYTPCASVGCRLVR